MLRHILILLMLLLLSKQALSANDPAVEFKFRYPVYIGFLGGYGSTTWGQLVPSKPSAAINMSTPVNTSEGGVTWGIVVGCELNPYFALEGAYQRYPNAKVSFDPFSLFAFEHNGLASLNTHTETMSLIGKIMLIIPQTSVRAYSGLGLAGVHRYDQVFNHWRNSPTFAAGFNYNFTPHIMGELGANYTAGYGESELDPAMHYVPFLYSAFFKLAYRF